MKNRQLVWRSAGGNETGRNENSQILVKIKKDAGLYAGRWLRVYTMDELEVAVEPPNERTHEAYFSRDKIEMIAFDPNDFPSLRILSSPIAYDGEVEHWITGERQKVKAKGWK